MLIPGTLGAFGKQNDVLLLSDALGSDFIVEGDLWNSSSQAYVTLPSVNVYHQFDDEMADTAMLAIVRERLARFAAVREDATGYVSKHYAWMSPDEQDRKVVEVAARSARAKQILAAFDQAG